jgi:hypothetical protein
MDPRAYFNTLKILHGLYNITIMFLFFYQGWLGLKIRRERTAGGTRDFSVIKRHRKNGPVFSLLGVLGFLAGLGLVYLTKGFFLIHPLHFFVGLGLVLLIGTTYVLSQKIKGPGSSLRTTHFIMGLLLLGLYVLQVFIGLDEFF